MVKVGYFCSDGNVDKNTNIQLKKRMDSEEKHSIFGTAKSKSRTDSKTANLSRGVPLHQVDLEKCRNVSEDGHLKTVQGSANGTKCSTSQNQIRLNQTP